MCQYFVHGHAAFAEGVGEKITYCEPAEKWFVVLKPDDSISTAVIFQDPNLPRNTPKKSLEQLLSEPYVNDCEKVVINHYSNVEKALNWLLQYAPARLTGTGAVWFLLNLIMKQKHKRYLDKNQKNFLALSLKDSMFLPCTQC